MIARPDGLPSLNLYEGSAPMRIGDVIASTAWCWAKDIKAAEVHLYERLGHPDGRIHLTVYRWSVHAERLAELKVRGVEITTAV